MRKDNCLSCHRGSAVYFSKSKMELKRFSVVSLFSLFSLVSIRKFLILVILLFYQTYMIFFLQQNTIENILYNVDNQSTDIPIGFVSIEVNGQPLIS